MWENTILRNTITEEVGIHDAVLRTNEISRSRNLKMLTIIA